MRFFLYAIFDSASGVYDRPFVAHADGAAVRSFGDLAADATHVVGMHPEHFSLFRLGDYDDNSGVVTPENVVCIAKAHELVAASRKVDGAKVVKLEKEIANA